MKHKPVFAINYKTYQRASAKNAQKLTATLSSISPAKIQTIVCVQSCDIYACANTSTKSTKSTLPVFAQHIDPIEYGAHTGHILAQCVKDNGASGTLLNHSEDKFDSFMLTSAVEHAKRAKLQTIVCVDSIERLRFALQLNPTFIAYEPPELIGGTVSVTTRPQIIRALVAEVASAKSETRLLVGAGIKSAQDISIALSLGCHGILLASAIADSKNPKQAYKELLKGF
jgi:triosephosphate isomerase (TIM)